MLTAIKEESDSNTIIVGNFNTSFTPMDRSSRQKINKETQALNDTLDQIDLQHIPSENSRLYIVLKCTWNILQDRSHLGHKSSLGNFKKSEIIPSIFSKSTL